MQRFPKLITFMGAYPNVRKLLISRAITAMTLFEHRLRAASATVGTIDKTWQREAQPQRAARGSTPINLDSSQPQPIETGAYAKIMPSPQERRSRTSTDIELGADPNKNLSIGRKHPHFLAPNSVGNGDPHSSYILPHRESTLRHCSRCSCPIIPLPPESRS